jgi:murein DD-endopeptidase MepM/ murein hydrolase activator NlpD
MQKMVSLSKIKDNPWRDRVRNPIDQDRVEAIAVSLEKTKKYWLGTYGREVPGGYVELAFGHHRLEAAKAQGLKEIPITIEHFTDGEMLVWMAQENVRGELPVVIEAVAAAVKALGEGKIEIEAPDPKTNDQHLRYAPSFIPGKKASSPTGGENVYTMDSLARYLGYIKKSTNRAKNSVVAAMGILERAEIASMEGGKEGVTKAVTLERSFSSMKVNDALKSLSEIKQREEKIAERREKTAEEIAEANAKQLRLAQEAKEREKKAQEVQEALLRRLADAHKEEDEKKAKAIQARLEAEKEKATETAATFKVKRAALDAKVEAIKEAEAQARKEDAYASIRRDVDCLLRKLEGSTSTTRGTLTEESKALQRKALHPEDRERLRQAALNTGNWYRETLADMFLPPLSGKCELKEMQQREEAKQRAAKRRKK